MLARRPGIRCPWEFPHGVGTKLSFFDDSIVALQQGCTGDAQRAEV